MLSKDLYNYTVFIDGCVYSHYRNIFLKPQTDAKGYYYYRLRNNGKVEHWFLHKLLATLFIPKVEGKEYVNHKNGVKKDNSIENLEWCTIPENNKHARDTKLNDISKSNSNRWDDNKFRLKTSQAISVGTLKSGSNQGRNNPRALVDMEYQGERYTLSELSIKLGISLSTLNNVKINLKKGKRTRLSDLYGITYVGTEGQSTIERVALVERT